MTAHAPSFTAARLYKKTSSKGGVYFAGRMGGVKVALLKSKDTAENGDEIWNLVFSEAAPYQPKEVVANSTAAAGQPTGRRSNVSAMRDYARPPRTVPDAPREPLPAHYQEIPF